MFEFIIVCALLIWALGLLCQLSAWFDKPDLGPVQYGPDYKAMGRFFRRIFGARRHDQN